MNSKDNPYLPNTSEFDWYQWGYKYTLNNLICSPRKEDTIELRAFNAGKETRVKEDLIKLLDQKIK